MASSLLRLSGFRAWLAGAVAILAIGFVASFVLPHEALCHSTGPRGLDWVSFDGTDLTMELLPSCTGPATLKWNADDSLSFWTLDHGVLSIRQPWRRFELREEGGLLRLDMGEERPPEFFACWPRRGAWEFDLRGLKSLADPFLQLSWASAILLGLLLGAGFSLLEAWTTRYLSRPRDVTRAALAARVLACWALGLLCAARSEWGQALPARGVGIAAALGFGQLFAASVLALRATDVGDTRRRGWLWGAPSHLFVLSTAFINGVALVAGALLFEHGWFDLNPLPPLLFAICAPLWVAAPVVLHAALPRFLKTRVRRAGLAVTAVLLAECIPGERAARLTHVLDGIQLWTRHVTAAFAANVAPANELAYLMGAALVFSLAALVLDVRRERRQRAT